MNYGAIMGESEGYINDFNSAEMWYVEVFDEGEWEMELETSSREDAFELAYSMHHDGQTVRIAHYANHSHTTELLLEGIDYAV